MVLIKRIEVKDWIKLMTDHHAQVHCHLMEIGLAQRFHLARSLLIPWLIEHFEKAYLQLCVAQLNY